MRMMPEAWAFHRGQARLVVPTWGHTAPDLARVGVFCTLIKGQGGRERKVYYKTTTNRGKR